MSGRTPHLIPLQTRKQLLIAESELNREQWSTEWQAMAQGVRHWADRTKTTVAWASWAALLVARFTALRRARPLSKDTKVSWIQRILQGGRAASTLWLALRRLGGKHK